MVFQDRIQNESLERRLFGIVLLNAVSTANTFM